MFTHVAIWAINMYILEGADHLISICRKSCTNHWCFTFRGTHSNSTSGTSSEVNFGLFVTGRNIFKIMKLLHLLAFNSALGQEHPATAKSEELGQLI
jgi:hypothetical protein